MSAPPHNIEAERYVIGAMLINPKIIPEVKDALSSLDFYREIHKDIFSVMSVKVWEPEIIINHLAGIQPKKDVQNALSEAVDCISTSAGWKHHAKLVKGASSIRQWLALSHYIQSECQKPAANPDIIASEAKAAIRDIEAELETGYLSMDKIVDDTVIEIKERAKGTISFQPVKTGLTNIDKVYGGFEPGRYNLIIARPGIGKTAFGLTLAKNIASSQPGTALIFSIEMGYRQLARRLLSDRSKIHLSRLKSGNIYHDEERLDEAARYLSETNMIIIDHPKYREIERLMTAAESIATQNSINCLILDHVQKTTSRKRFTNDNSKYEYISGELAALAKALNVPFFVLCQLNRELESRPENQRRPRISDIRGSGAFEQDGDVIMGLHRTSRESQILQVEGLKDRDGDGAGKLVYLRFRGSTQTIEDIDPDEAMGILQAEKTTQQSVWRGGL